MKKLIIILVLFLLNKAIIQPSESKTCIVSLGANCRVSTWLKDLNLRYHAYPFDWVESEDVEGLISLINNDFKDYLLRENLVPHFKHYYNRVQDQIYKISLVHDFSFQGNEFFSFANQDDLIRGTHSITHEHKNVYGKYIKRINRFRNLAQEYDKIFFVRVLNIDKNSAQYLYDALKKLFKNSVKIILITISDTQDFEEDWDLEGIKNFYMPLEHLMHDGYSQDFLKIINTMH